MKTIFILIFACLILISNPETSNCQSIAKSLNSLTTYGRLRISTPSTVNLYSICPGCSKDWSNDIYCLVWEVSTTRTSQRFRATFTNPANASTYGLDWEWQYQDDYSGQWKSFNNPKFPTSAYGHANNVFTVESSSFQCITVIKFRVCIKGLQTQCTQNSGTVNLGYNVSVVCY